MREFGNRGCSLTCKVPACRYGCSKWASEVQLQQLHERYGVPVSIFRCGMILAHSRRASVLRGLLSMSLWLLAACSQVLPCGTYATLVGCQESASAQAHTTSGTWVRSTRPTSSRACWRASCSRAWRLRPSTGTPPGLTATLTACALPALLRSDVMCDPGDIAHDEGNQRVAWLTCCMLGEIGQCRFPVIGWSLCCVVKGSTLRLYLCVEAIAAACRPIDFVAAGITGVLSHHRSGLDAYHVVNPHWDDGVSLDAIVGWVAEARGGVRHIQDYSQWCVPSPSPALTSALTQAHAVSSCRLSDGRNAQAV